MVDVTEAICLSCGRRRLGAISACDQCGVASTGNFNLDTLFSDWVMSETALDHFGSIIQTIQKVETDEDVRWWTFMLHFSEHYPGFLSIDLTPEAREKAESLLSQLALPTITLNR